MTAPPGEPGHIHRWIQYGDWGEPDRHMAAELVASGVTDGIRWRQWRTLPVADSE